MFSFAERLSFRFKVVNHCWRVILVEENKNQVAGVELVKINLCSDCFVCYVPLVIGSRRSKTCYNLFSKGSFIIIGLHNVPRDFVTGDKQRSDQVLARYSFLNSLLVELYRRNQKSLFNPNMF